MQHSDTNKENLSMKGLLSSDEKEHATCISKGNATIQNKRTKPCTCPKKPERLTVMKTTLVVFGDTLFFSLKD